MTPKLYTHGNLYSPPEISMLTNNVKTDCYVCALLRYYVLFFPPGVASINPPVGYHKVTHRDELSESEEEVYVKDDPAKCKKPAHK